jgi:CDP-diacylglycerol--serine O-phosphatidyltransferase
LTAADHDSLAQAPKRASRLSIADAITLGNASLGFLAIIFMTGTLGSQLVGSKTPRNDAVVAILLLTAAILDVLDGLVARKLGCSSLGIRLDSLADVVSFGVAPAVLVVAWTRHSSAGGRLVGLLAAGAVLATVLLRLARFRPADQAFRGLPCPLAALTVIAVVLLNPPYPVAIGSIIGLASLMVSSLPYPKPRGRLAVIAVAWAVICLAGLLIAVIGVPSGRWLISAAAICAVLLVLALSAAGVPRAARRRPLMIRADRGVRDGEQPPHEH